MSMRHGSACRASAWAVGGRPARRAEMKRIKIVVMSSGSYDLGSDLFDYYPPIQDRVRWIIGARDLAEARRKLRDYTMETTSAEHPGGDAHRLRL